MHKRKAVWHGTDPGECAQRAYPSRRRRLLSESPLATTYELDLAGDVSMVRVRSVVTARRTATGDLVGTRRLSKPRIEALGALAPVAWSTRWEEVW